MKILQIFKEFVLKPALISIILAVFSLLILEKEYTSTSKMIPINKNGISSQSNSMAVQGLLGFNFSNQSSSSLSSANYFHLILKSNSTIEKLMTMKINDNQLFVENFLDKNYEEISSIDLENAINKFKLNNISLNKDRISNLITLNVNYSDPTIAQKISLFLIDETIQRQRSSNSEFSFNRKQYLNQRINETTIQLQKAEERLIQFRTSNTNLNSVYLTIELEKLGRERRLIENIITGLIEELEKLKINEVTDNNEIQILDPPSLPQSKSSPRGSIISIFSFIFLFISNLLWSIYRNEIKIFLKNIELN